jgi:hypothetical protein
VGGFEAGVEALVEPSVKYHPVYYFGLTWLRESGLGTELAGQFDWGGLLQKGHGGVQRSAQHGWKSCVECNSISRLYCESYMTNSHESGL